MRLSYMSICWAGLAFAEPFSRTPAELLELASKVKSEEGSVVLADDIRLEFDAAGARSYKIHRIGKVLSESGKDSWSSITIPYAPWYEKRPGLRARVITPDGKAHILDQSTIAEGPARAGRPDIFDDRRVIRAPFPAVSTGAVIEVEMTGAETRPSFDAGTVGRTVLSGSSRVEKSRLEFVFPESLPFRYKAANIPDSAIKRVAADGRVTVTIETGPLPANRHFDPHLPSGVTVLPSVRYGTGRSWKEVAARYAELTDRQLAGAGVTSMAARGDGREQTIRALLAKLHREIRYTGVAFGEAAWIPNRPAETMKRKYGDCKDKSALLVAMLRAAGIDAKIALLSTGPGLDIDPSLPGLGAFDHAIVHVPGEPAYWIDATDELAGLGELAAADQGRFVLIADPATTGLTRTPVLPSSENRIVEKREFWLADEGPARVLETSSWHGTSSSGARRNYLSFDEKPMREGFETYVKEQYLAETLGKFDYSGAADLSKTFQLKIEAEKAERGMTDPIIAEVAIPTEGITNSMPEYLRTESEGEQKSLRDNRTYDLELPDSSITEWHYRIVPPRGYKARDLPKTTRESLGSATFSQEFETQPDGVVTGVLKFDMGKRLLTPAEIKATRDALVEFRKRDPVMVNFSQTGEELLEQGKIREALGEFRKLADADPKNALTRTRIARALLAGGMGEEARAVARQATVLDPGSATAWSTLGNVLRHDLVGRLLKKGFDRHGAIEAYEKAVQLAPKALYSRADYAILLEHDSEGARYSKKASLDKAIEQYRAVEKEMEGTEYALNLPFALLAGGRFAELRDSTKSQQTKDGYGLYLAGVAGAESTAAALSEASKQIQGSDRAQVIATAASFLMRARRYPQAADLFAAAASGQPNAAGILNLANVLRTARPFEDRKFDTAKPGELVMALLRDVEIFPQGADTSGVKRYFTNRAREARDEEDIVRASSDGMRRAAAQNPRSGLSREALLDFAVASMQVAQEGSDRDGYRVKVAFGPAMMLTAITIPEDGVQKIVALSPDFSLVGEEALRRARANGLASARKLLDWVREATPLPGGDDPLAGSPFARIWERGDKAPRPAIEAAAAVLMLGSSQTRAAGVEILERYQPEAEGKRLIVDLALGMAYASMKENDKAAARAERLLAAKPLSDRALVMAVGIQAARKDWKSAAALCDARLARDAGNAEALRHAAGVAMAREDWSTAVRLYSKLEESGKATAADLNEAAWVTLFNGTAATAGMEIATKALAKNQQSSELLHTLASIYAETGKTTEARELILQALDVVGREEPNGADWYVFGRIAEQHGVPSAAKKMYERATAGDQEDPSPFSTAVLAKRRLEAVR